MMTYNLVAEPSLGQLEQGGVTVTTDRQHAVVVRPGSAADSGLLFDMHRRLSERTIYLRFGVTKASFDAVGIHDQTARMLGDSRMATTLIGMAGAGEAVSVAELVQRPDDPTQAEVALLVRDDYQREGLGRALCGLLGQVAAARGVRTLRINTLAENSAVMRLIRRLGARYTAETRQGETTVLVEVG